MAITSSAKKAIRVSARKHVFNLRRKDALSRTTKSFTKAPTTASLSAAYKAIDKAAKQNVITKNTASRKKSRLAKALAKVSK